MFFRLNNVWLIINFACLIPLLALIFDINFNRLGADPVQAMHIRLGDWSMRFLWLTLVITPVQTFTKWQRMAVYRQMLGLYAFFYASLHVMTYLSVDHGFMWQLIGIDILESSYIWFGLIAYFIILLLAVSSPKSGKKRMGKNWKKLHQFIYIAAIAVIIHYYWQLKGNLAEPLFYLIIIILLLGFRIAVWFKNRQFNKMMIPTTKRVSVASIKQVSIFDQTVELSATTLKESIIQKILGYYECRNKK
jgi:sulfoxide reductase heme-binding subunit YedZ